LAKEDKNKTKKEDKNKTKKDKIMAKVMSEDTIDKFINIILRGIVESDLPEIRISVIKEISKFRKNIEKDIQMCFAANSSNSTWLTTQHINKFLNDSIEEVLKKNISNKKNIFDSLKAKQSIVNQYM
jgi:hypothetical protein